MTQTLHQILSSDRLLTIACLFSCTNVYWRFHTLHIQHQILKQILNGVFKIKNPNLTANEEDSRPGLALEYSLI